MANIYLEKGLVCSLVMIFLPLKIWQGLFRIAEKFLREDDRKRIVLGMHYSCNVFSQDNKEADNCSGCLVNREKPKLNQILEAKAHPTLDETADHLFFLPNLAHGMPMLPSIFIAIIGSHTPSKRPLGFLSK